MKKLIILLAILAPAIVAGQQTVRFKNVKIDSNLILSSMLTDTSTLILVLGADGKVRANRAAGMGAVQTGDQAVDLYSVGVLGEIKDVVPAGNLLVHVTVINNALTPVTAKLGWTSGGSQLLDGEEISGSGWIDIPVNRLLSLTAATSLWIDSEDMQDEGFTLLVQHKKFID